MQCGLRSSVLQCSLAARPCRALSSTRPVMAGMRMLQQQGGRLRRRAALEVVATYPEPETEKASALPTVGTFWCQSAPVMGCFCITAAAAAATATAAAAHPALPGPCLSFCRSAAPLISHRQGRRELRDDLKGCDRVVWHYSSCRCCPSCAVLTRPPGCPGCRSGSRRSPAGGPTSSPSLRSCRRRCPSPCRATQRCAGLVSRGLKKARASACKAGSGPSAAHRSNPTRAPARLCQHACRQ